MYLGSMDAETVKGLILRYFYRNPFSQAEVNYHLAMIQTRNWSTFEYERWLEDEDAHLDVFIPKVWGELYSGGGLIPNEPMQPVSAWKQIYRHNNDTDASFTQYLKNSVQYKAFTAKKETAREAREAAEAAAAAATSSKKEAGMFNLDFFKSPWLWVALALGGGWYYWTQVKHRSMGQIPYVGQYLGGKRRGRK
jgi:hypothetical protein